MIIFSTSLQTMRVRGACSKNDETYVIKGSLEYKLKKQHFYQMYIKLGKNYESMVLNPRLKKVIDTECDKVIANHFGQNQHDESCKVLEISLKQRLEGYKLFDIKKVMISNVSISDL